MENNEDLNNRVRLANQILWENRKIYIELFENYLESKMNAEDVVNKFLMLYYTHNNPSKRLPLDPEILQKLPMGSELEEFSELMEMIFSDCDALDVRETDDNSNYPWSEHRFRKEISLRLQKLKAYD